MALKQIFVVLIQILKIEYYFIKFELFGLMTLIIYFIQIKQLSGI